MSNEERQRRVLERKVKHEVPQLPIKERIAAAQHEAILAIESSPSYQQMISLLDGSVEKVIRDAVIAKNTYTPSYEGPTAWEIVVCKLLRKPLPLPPGPVCRILPESVQISTSKGITPTQFIEAMDTNYFVSKFAGSAYSLSPESRLAVIEEYFSFLGAVKVMNENLSRLYKTKRSLQGAYESTKYPSENLLLQLDACRVEIGMAELSLDRLPENYNLRWGGSFYLNGVLFPEIYWTDKFETRDYEDEETYWLRITAEGGMVNTVQYKAHEVWERNGSSVSARDEVRLYPTLDQLKAGLSKTGIPWLKVS